MLRSALVPKDRSGETYFRWRGGDVSRLEGLTDAVIALALTLIVLSTEIPRDSAELFGLFRQLPAFAATFALLAMVWWYHFRFHRRFGLEDFVTSVLNLALLFVLLLFVYPLRFLFGELLSGDVGSIPPEHRAPVMLLYGGGYLVVFLLFTALHLHAWRQRDALELDDVERAVTRGALRAHALHALVGLVSTALALAVQLGAPRALLPVSGLVFFAIGPLQGWNGFRWGREADRLLRARVSSSGD